MKKEDGARLHIQWSAQHGRTGPHNRLMVEEMGHKQVIGAVLKARSLREVN
jgi:hypothetical protein